MEINGEDELVPFGNFIIQKPDSEETEEKTEFTGYDYMIKFNATYTDRVTYPITAGELFEDVCDQVGVECGNTEFVNSDYEISGNPFTNNEDCKTVLSNLAQLAGGFAHIGRDNKCYIQTLSVEEITSLTVQDITAMTVAEVDALSVSALTGTGSTESGSSLAEGIDGNNYFDFSKNNEFGPVNCVILSLSSIEGENTTLQDDESIEEYGTTEITIEDNYFLTSEEEREKVITNIYNALNGLTYLPFKASYYGFPYLDVGDAILIYDTDDNYYISYVFSHTFTYNGAYSGELETKALTETQTAYKNTNDIKTKFKRTERSIDKINGLIEDVIEEVDENSEKISQHTQDIDSITDTIQTEITTSLSDTETSISNTYQELLEKIGEINTTLEATTVEIKESVQTALTSSEYAIEVAQSASTDVTEVTTTTGFTFNADGLTIEKSGAEVSSKLDEAGLEIVDNTGSSGEELLYAGYDEETGETVVRTKNIEVSKYLTVGKYSRFEDYEADGKLGTGVFWIGG